MSQISRMLNNEARISLKADDILEQTDFVDLSQLVDQESRIHADPYQTISFIQGVLHRLWKIQAKDPYQRCTGFAKWYMSIDIPVEPCDMYPWLARFASHFMQYQRIEHRLRCVDA
jgi:hypothetical protein